MNEQPQACCAHTRVSLHHIDYPDGTRADVWECDSGCGIQFVPVQSRRLRRVRPARTGTGAAFEVLIIGAVIVSLLGIILIGIGNIIRLCFIP